MVIYGDIDPEPYCGARSFMDTLSSYNIFGATMLVGIGLVFSYLGYLALKQMVNILWYHFMVSKKKKFLRQKEFKFHGSLKQ